MVYRRAAKANTVLSTVVIISFAEITRIGAAASPVTYVELAATVPTAKKTHQKALPGANRGHGFIPLPVYGITPRHSLILFIRCPVNIAHMMIGDEDPALLGSTRGSLTLLQLSTDIRNVPFLTTLEVSLCRGTLCSPKRG
jgi:hypothetical protein